MKKPNLLFLYTDEQRFDTLAAYGNDQIEMPNLNRFAEKATVFDECYVTQPVCTPSRSTLLTGLYPHTNGCTANNIPLSADTRCFPELLDDPEYVTGHYGKWHLGDEIFAQHGFQHWRGIEDQYRAHYSEGRPRDALSDYSKFLIEENGLQPEGMDYFHRGAAARLPEKYCKPRYLAREACAFLRENQDKPFVLYVNFLEPHMPFFGPRDEQYDPDSIPLPDNYDNPPGEDQHPRPLGLYHKWQESIPTEKETRELIARYWGLCSLVDSYAGQILETLEELGLDENTIVVYTSDHGDMMGSHQLVAKTVMYQESVRVPFLIRTPGQKEARRVSGPVSQIDITPTLLDLMGKMPPESLQGKSLKPWMESGKSLEDDIVIQWNGDNGKGPEQVPGIKAEVLEQAYKDPVRTIITHDGWRFTCSPLGFHELYNLNDDPGETKNLAIDPEHKPIMRDLRGRIVKWQEQNGDTVELPEI